MDFSEAQQSSYVALVGKKGKKIGYKFWYCSMDYISGSNQSYKLSLIEA